MKYLNLLLITISASLLSACGIKAVPPDLSVLVPEISSVEVVPGVDNARLTATISGPANYSGCGFVLHKSGKITELTAEAGLQGRSFEAVATGLDNDTEYGVEAYISNADLRIMSNRVTFKTKLKNMPSEEPEVSDNPPVSDDPSDSPSQDVSEEPVSVPTVFISLLSSAGIRSVQLEAIVEYGGAVEYSGFGVSREGRRSVEYGAALDGGRMTREISDLFPSTDYTWYAFIVIDGERTTSDYAGFTTLDDPSEEPSQDPSFEPVVSDDPEVGFADVSASVEGTTVTLRAIISPSEGITDCGFGVSLNNYDFIEYDATVESDSIYKTLAGLEPGKYYYYAYCYSSGNRFQSNTETFNIP